MTIHSRLRHEAVPHGPVRPPPRRTARLPQPVGGARGLRRVLVGHARRGADARPGRPFRAASTPGSSRSTCTTSRSPASAATRSRAGSSYPPGPPDPLPVVVEFIGYGGGREPAPRAPALGLGRLAHFVMDTRGQGSGWGAGRHRRPGGLGARRLPGFMTRGIEDPGHVLLPPGDHGRRTRGGGGPLASAGRRLPHRGRSAASQGGGLALAVAGLVPDLAAVAPDVPFLCDFPAGDPDHRPQALPRDRRLPQDAPRPGRAGRQDPRLLRRGALRRARAGPRPVLRGHGGPDLPAVHGVRRVQRVRARRRRRSRCTTSTTTRAAARSSTPCSSRGCRGC